MAEERRSKLYSALVELKRRHVIRVLGAYTVTFWVVLQVAEIVLPALMAPEGTMMIVILVGVAGAPVAAALSWFYDLTSQGIRKADAVPVGDEVVRVLGGRWLDYVIIAALVIILAVVLARPGDVLPRVGSTVAILPFADMSAESDSRYFGDGIAEAIMDRLAGVEGIRVAARTSSFALRETGLDARTTAERLGVETLVEGSVRRAGNQIRISARLIEGKSGTQVWSETYGGALDNIFELQDRISAAIARIMQVELDLPGSSVLETDVPEAYDEYLRGRDRLRQQRSEVNVEQAIAHFRNALSLDPEFALASAGLCRARWERYEIGREPQLAESAMAHCREAETRFPDLAETRIAIGSLQLGTGKLERAESSFRSALKLEPNNAEAHSGLSLALLHLNRLAAAEAEARFAIRMDPAYWRYHSDLGKILYFAGNLNAAIDAVHQAMRLGPENPEPWNTLGGIHFAQGKFRLAGDAFEQSLRRSPNAVAYSNAGTNYFFAGEFSRAEMMFLRAAEMTPDDPRMNGFLAWSIRAQAGREAEAEPYHRAVIRTATQRLAINVTDHESRAMLAMHLAALGHSIAARGAIASIAEPSELDMNSLLTTGFAHYLLGDMEPAVAMFEQALDKGLPFYLLQADPRLQTAWTDPQFAALAARHQPSESFTQGDSP